MADTNTPRRVLQDLPINTFGTPKAVHLPPPIGLKLKRPFQEVEGSASPPASSRPRLSDDVENGQPPICSKPASKPTPTTASDVKEDDVMGESTQDTNNNVGSSFVDSDMEGDTMGTQQTAATEWSQHTRRPTLSSRACRPPWLRRSVASTQFAPHTGPPPCTHTQADNVFHSKSRAAANALITALLGCLQPSQRLEPRDVPNPSPASAESTIITATE
ncbi:MAG: hypothetical protein Q9181_003739 [Wetmoreana brouardii]